MLWRASRALKFGRMPTWSSCGPTVKADAEQFRKRIDALWGNRDALLSQIFRDGWKLEPPDPGWRTATSQASPTPQIFSRQPIFFCTLPRIVHKPEGWLEPNVPLDSQHYSCTAQGFL